MKLTKEQKVAREKCPKCGNILYPNTKHMDNEGKEVFTWKCWDCKYTRSHLKQTTRGAMPKHANAKARIEYWQEKRKEKRAAIRAAKLKTK